MDIVKTNYGRFVVVDAVVETNAPLKQAYIAEKQDWEIKDQKKGTTGFDPQLERLIGQKLTTQSLTVLRKHGVEKVRILLTILVPPLGNLPVAKGQKVIKGDPLTEGPLDPHEVLDLAGPNAVYEYFITNLQSVYKDQGVDINDKHLEVIIRQMLRKRLVKEPGDTPFLPGQIVDRFTFNAETSRVRTLIDGGQKRKYTDPVTGEEKERELKTPTAAWILLGITEASLNTDSFLSAASFQKTTRVLTDAAVRGKHDPLNGLKENVIIGRLIPAGTGVKSYRDLAIEVDRSTPAWAQQSLQSLAETDGRGEGSLAGMSIRDLAEQDANQLIAENAEGLDLERPLIEQAGGGERPSFDDEPPVAPLPLADLGDGGGDDDDDLLDLDAVSQHQPRLRIEAEPDIYAALARAERAEIEPAAIGRLLGDIFLLENSENPRYAVRLAGTRLCALIGHEMRGRGFGPSSPRKTARRCSGSWRRSPTGRFRRSQVSSAKPTTAAASISKCCCCPCAIAGGPMRGCSAPSCRSMSRIGPAPRRSRGCGSRRCA